MKHFLMTTESDFTKTVGKLVDKALQHQMQLNDDSGAKTGAAACRDDSQDLASNDISRCETTAYASACEFLPMPAKYISGEDRTRTYPKNTGNSSISDQSAAKSGAVYADSLLHDPDLALIVSKWMTLPAPIRRAMLALLDYER
jgi:hypothetical protein